MTKRDWIERDIELISEILEKIATAEGAEVAHEAICRAIMSWIDYHQKALNEWHYLAARLNLPLPSASSTSSSLRGKTTTSDEKKKA